MPMSPETLVRLRPEGMKLAQSLLNKKEDAEDAVSEATYRLLKISTTIHPESERNYYFSTLYNICTDVIRRRYLARFYSLDQLPPGVDWMPDDGVLSSWAENLFDKTPGPEAQALSKEGVKRIYQVLRRLPQQSQECFALQIRGWELEQIARRFGISENTVKTRLFRGRNLLRAARAEEQASF